MKRLDGRPFRLGFSSFALFTGLAGDLWRNWLGWPVFGAIVMVIFGMAILTIVHRRREIGILTLPFGLVGFLVFATVSLAWSFYPGSSALGIAVQWITTAVAVAVAILLSREELLKVLGWVLRAILALSYLFEFVVAAFVRHPVLPIWADTSQWDSVPKVLYWSRGLLFDGGKIQGILGNSSLLAMISLIAVIVFAIQLGSRSTGRISGWVWLVIAASTLVITRSATIYVALAVVIAVAAIAAIVRLARTPRIKAIVYSVIAAGAVALAASIELFSSTLLRALGKSSDFTGRTGIWDAVIALADQRPAVGWGWVSYWTPWVEPFKGLIVRNRVEVTHAHNAWLDVWLQVGIVGVVLFAALILALLARAWLMVQDADKGRGAWVAALPLLVITAQLVQSIAESRILVEGGWMLLVIMACTTKWSMQRSGAPAGTVRTIAAVP